MEPDVSCTLITLVMMPRSARLIRTTSALYQVKDDTIVVSTDIVRLPQEMDPDDIMGRLIRLNDDSKESELRFNVPWLYHDNADMNRVLYVIKELRALSDLHVIAALPDVIKDVLTANGGFNKLFNSTK